MKFSKLQIVLMAGAATFALWKLSDYNTRRKLDNAVQGAIDANPDIF